MDGQVLAYDYPVLGAFWTVMWVFLWILWLLLLFRVITDIFRDRALSGWAKAAWLVFVAVLPFLGILVYLIARGQEMADREIQHVRAQREAFDSMEKGEGISELAKLSELKASGDVTEEEFQRAKEKILR